jgi:hypothetical protein
MGLGLSKSSEASAVKTAASLTAKHNLCYKAQIEKFVNAFVTTEYRQPLLDRERRYALLKQPFDFAPKFEEYNEKERVIVRGFLTYPFDTLKQRSIDEYLEHGTKDLMYVKFNHPARIPLYIPLCVAVFGCCQSQIAVCLSNGQVVIKVKPTKKDLIRWSSELTALRNGTDAIVDTDAAVAAVADAVTDAGATDAGATDAGATDADQGTANPMLQI